MLIKAAINGGRKKAEHRAVPVSPKEQAVAVAECVKAGAGAIHLHVRDTSGDENFQSAGESLYAKDVAQTLLPVLAFVPKSQIGISTGAWILPDPTARWEAVAAWDVLPGFASVNFSEDGAVDLARLLLSRGVDVEVGLCNADAAEVFLESGLVSQQSLPSSQMSSVRCIRVLLEPQEQTMERALETVRGIEKVFDSGAIELPRLLHGTEATVWPMMDEAIARGYHVRVGLEDTLLMPDGRIARDNSELIKEAVRRVAASGRRAVDCGL
jgi:uncharacterized protein (DUF849 family)